MLLQKKDAGPSPHHEELYRSPAQRSSRRRGVDCPVLSNQAFRPQDVLQVRELRQPQCKAAESLQNLQYAALVISCGLNPARSLAINLGSAPFSRTGTHFDSKQETVLAKKKRKGGPTPPRNRKKSNKNKLIAVSLIALLAVAAVVYVLSSLGGSAKPGVEVTTDSGLKYVDEVVGTGKSPSVGGAVTVHYTGTLEDG